MIDTREPGWQVYQGQAIWRPKRDLPDLTGDLLFARHSDGRSFVQFTKTPLVLAEGHRNQRTWSIRFPPRNLSFGGSGSPPARFGWLQLDHAWSGYPVAKGWRFVRVDEGELHLENPQTGERMEVHLWP